MGQVKPFAKLAAVCAFIALCGYVACSLVFPTIYIRYRLSLDVERDGKVQTSAGVIEISYPILPDLSVEGGMFHGQMHGNAITIELGDQGLAFVVNLLSLAPKPGAGSSGPLRPTETCFLWQLPLAAFGLPIDGEPSTMEKLLRQLQREKRSVDVPIGRLPMFVHFADINDPRSIEEIDPGDLEATFGPGVRLLRARVELTNDPITPIPPVWPKWLVDAKTLGFPMKRYGGSKYPSTNLWVQGFKGE
jgi:hypothetical protein